MILGIFLAVCAAGTLLGLMFQRAERLSQVVNLGALACAAIAAAALGSGGQSLAIGDGHLSTTSYATAFLFVAAMSCLLLCVVGVAAHPAEAVGRLAPAALAAIGGFGVAFTSGDPRVSLMAGTAAAATGTLTLLHRPGAGGVAGDALGAEAAAGTGRGGAAGAGASAAAALGAAGAAGAGAGAGAKGAAGAARAAVGRSNDAGEADAPDGRVTELRILALIGGALLLAAIVAMRPTWTGPQDRAFGAAFLALALAVAVRGGAIPFHVPASHLSKTATPSAMALLLILVPAGIGALALTWSPIAFHATASWMDLGIGSLQGIAIATILLGALAALVHDRLEEIVAYSIVADAGFILAALAARSEDAAEPARMWLLVFVAGKTALVAWAAAMSRAFSTSDLSSLRGWLRRTPLLGLCLIAIGVATIGWPQSGAAMARGDIIRLGLGSQLQLVEALAIAFSAAYFARLLVVGLLRPSATVRESWSERPRLGFALRRPRPAEPEPPGERPVLAATIAPAVAPSGALSESTATTVVAEAATETPTAAAEPAGTATPATKRKRRAKAAAAENPAPTVTSEAPPASSAETSEQTHPDLAAAEAVTTAESDAAGSTASSPPEPKKLVIRRRRRSGPSIRHRLALMWRLNRTLEVSAVMAMAAVFSLAVAAGSFGSSKAAKDGLPLGTAAHATSTPRATATLPPTQAPLQTGTPIPSAGASGLKSAPPTPIGPPRTSAPTPIIK